MLGFSTIGERAIGQGETSSRSGTIRFTAALADTRSGQKEGRGVSFFRSLGEMTFDGTVSGSGVAVFEAVAVPVFTGIKSVGGAVQFEAVLAFTGKATRAGPMQTIEVDVDFSAEGIASRLGSIAFPTEAAFTVSGTGEHAGGTAFGAVAVFAVAGLSSRSGAATFSAIAAFSVTTPPFGRVRMIGRYRPAVNFTGLI